MSAARSRRTLAVAGGVALVCALIVATAQVQLRPRIEANIAAEREARVAGMLAQIPGLEALLGGRGVAALEPVLIDLATGQPAQGDALGFDPVAAAEDPATGRGLPPGTDIAGLGRIATQGVVYLIRDDAGRLALVILPVRGQGYQSVIRGMLALEADLTTVAALTITDQAETPGLGARIQTPAWTGLWPGRTLRDETGALAIEVVRGRAAAAHQVGVWCRRVQNPTLSGKNPSHVIAQRAVPVDISVGCDRFDAQFLPNSGTDVSRLAITA